MDKPYQNKDNSKKNDDEVKKKEAMKKIVGGGSALLFFGLLGGLIGWAFNAIWSRSDIGIGPSLYGVIASATAIAGSLVWISAGFHNAISKYMSAALVTSREKASRHVSAGFFVLFWVGLFILIIFMVLALIFSSSNFYLTVIFIVTGLTIFCTFLRDGFVGYLGGIQRFDRIALVQFSLVSGIVVGVIGWLFFSAPLNVIIIMTGGLLIGALFQILVGYLFYRKYKKFDLHFLAGSTKEDKMEIFKYGLYCAVPMLVLMGTIYSISTIYYTFFLGANSELVAIYGMLVGYSSIMGSSVVFGWPQVPAISEAKEKQDDEMIDLVVKNAFKMGMNFSMFFLCLYASMAHAMMFLFHGPEYIMGTLPLILHSLAVVFIGLDFLACSLLIGIGEGKKAGIIIAILSLSILTIVPIFIPIVPFNTVLLVGPVTLLVVSIALFPTCFHYILKHTSNPKTLYGSILWKGGASASLAIIISWTIQFFLIPGYLSFLHFVGVALIGLGLFLAFMLFFGGFEDEDFKLVESIKIMKPLIKAFKKINEKSPFFHEKDKKCDK